MRICVYCSSSSSIDDGYIALADQLGTALARRGHSLVSGGGSVSSMGAVARAVRAEGRHTLGVIPEALLELEVGDRGADELLVTRTMRERKALMDERADAFVALAGGLGTLEELLEIWVGRVLRLHVKPVVVLDPQGLFTALRHQVDVLVEQGFARASARDAVSWVTSVDEALDLVERGASTERGAGTEQQAADAEELAEGE
ncbi:MAG TPA: TIGR00730 family Rossman fold protein [Frankiaceae bacterium]|nr:TIGR00730 family Rossman fold protein [Frankiaceae bacterium]